MSLHCTLFPEVQAVIISELSAQSVLGLLWRGNGMPLIQGTQAFTASQVIDDVLVNNILASNFRVPYRVDYGLKQSAAPPGLVMTLKVGLNIVSQDLVPGGENRIPIYPDDYLGSFGVLPGDRILLSGRETSAAAKTLFFAFRFTPIG